MRFSIQHGLTACNVRLSAPCVAGHAPKLTINGTAFTVATVRIVGKPYLTGLGKKVFRTSAIGKRNFMRPSLDDEHHIFG